MQAIEFDAYLQDGMIQLPPPYRHWRDAQPVKVIVLATDRVASSADLQRHAGTITLTEDPLAFQAAMRDDWS